MGFFFLINREFLPQQTHYDDKNNNNEEKEKETVEEKEEEEEKPLKYIHSYVNSLNQRPNKCKL